MSEKEKRMHRCCFAGHRPEKLYLSERQVKAALAKEIWSAYQTGFRTFLTGMARSVDIWAGGACAEAAFIAWGHPSDLRHAEPQF